MNQIATFILLSALVLAPDPPPPDIPVTQGRSAPEASRVQSKAVTSRHLIMKAIQ